MAASEPVMQMMALVILDLFSSLSLRMPPSTVDMNPQRERIAALYKLNSVLKSGYTFWKKTGRKYTMENVSKNLKLPAMVTSLAVGLLITWPRASVNCFNGPLVSFSSVFSSFLFSSTIIFNSEITLVKRVT